MIALVGAGPVARLVDDCREVGATEVWSPISVPSALARVPGPIGRFANRRRVDADVRGPLLIADAALRAWARDRTDRTYLGEFALRVAIDAWAAREVAKRKPSTVIASSLAARSTFAAARAIGATCVLVIDIPLLRALHRDLDRAVERWPTREFLRNYRAPAWAIARQEAERVMADLILVRGPYAKSLCIADGVPANRVAVLPSTGPTIAAPARPVGRIRLAGLAAARHGIDTALAAAQRLGVTLVVRSGEGTEPADLASRAGVADVAHDREPVDAIICPAVCETYAPELRATGIPVIASPMASRDGRGPDPFDADALARAIEVAMPQTVETTPSIASLLAALA